MPTYIPKDYRANAAEFSSWRGMNSRCHCKGDGSYKHYGGRGITVYPAWRGRGNFPEFLAYMGPKPDPSYEIDRIDGEKGYEPGNVRWVTRSENSRNKSAAALARSLEAMLRVNLERSGQRILRQPARLRAHYAWASLRRNGNVLGVVEQHKLMDAVRAALVEEFGPTRNMPEPKPGEFSVEQAFVDAEYGFDSEHFAGLATDVAHPDWDATRRSHLHQRRGFMWTNDEAA